VKIFTVDAFTEVPFHGNPAGVCLLEDPQDDTWLGSVAAEMNLSETAFVLRAGKGWRLRWFTPTTEVPLCGHATLSAAHVLREVGTASDADTIQFFTDSGELRARFDGDWIELDFPALPSEECPIPSHLESILGTHAIAGTATDKEHLVVELESARVLRTLSPDYTAMLQLPESGVILTSASDDDSYDFLSRFFAPKIGINEDPVTGVGHCYLTPYWSERLGKKEFVAYQASARGGAVRCALRGERVHLAGKAVTIFSATLHA